MVSSRRASGALLCAALVMLGSSCASDPPRKPRSPTPTAAVAEEEVGEAADAFSEDVMEGASRALGERIGAIYQQARELVTPTGGSVRYWGDYLDYIEITATLAMQDVGFGGLEYEVDCDSTRPPAICAIARAFSDAELRSAAEPLARLAEAPRLQVRFVGKADPVWTARGKPRTYGGECGEGTCATDDGDLILSKGMAIDSNRVLACLRAQCLLAESNLDSAAFDVRIRGVVAKEGAQEESRRAEVALSATLTKKAHRMVWRAFRAAIGHRG